MANIDNPQAFDQLKQETYRIIDPLVNNKLVREVLEPATSLRGTKGTKVDAILMLTNNLSTNYAATISMYFYDLFVNDANAEGLFEQIREGPNGDPRVPKVKHYFDYIMVRDHPSRTRFSNPPKRLEDVWFMIEAIGKSTDDLIKRIFFFDDFINLDTMQKHFIRSQMIVLGSPNQYIFVKGSGPHSSGGYTRGSTDSTDYSIVRKAFEQGISLKKPQASATQATQAQTKGRLSSALAELQATTGTDPVENNQEDKSLEAQQAYMASVSSKKTARPGLPLFSKGGYKKTRKHKNKKNKKKKTIKR
jgi:hypothetical protein